MFTGIGRRLALTSAALVATLGLAACAGQVPATSAGSTSTSASPSVASVSPSPTKSTYPAVYAGRDTNPFAGLAGAFGLVTGDDFGAAAAAGVQITITPYIPAQRDLVDGIRGNGIKVIDKFVQWQMYNSSCKAGSGKCVEVTGAEEDKMLNSVRQVAWRNKNNPDIIGYYLVDDYWGDFSKELPKIYNAIREIDPVKPTVCGISGMVMAQTPDVTPKVDMGVFAMTLNNYSPSWCDAIYLYSFSPVQTEKVDLSMEWSMERQLPLALDLLKAKGWDPAKSPLIGGPQAFGYWPRLDGTRESWRAAPTEEQLLTQMHSFCTHGATSLIGYIWDDPAKGEIQDLANSEKLRSAFTKGVSECRAIWGY